MAKGKQFSIRLNECDSELLDSLLVFVSGKCGADLSINQLFAMSLKSLARESGHTEAAAEKTEPPPSRNRQNK